MESSLSNLLKVGDSFDAFDTEVSVSLCLDDRSATAQQEAYQAFLEIRSLCQRYEELFSRTIPSSDVSRINQAKGAATPVAQQTALLIKAALPYCERSRSLFDITVGSATQLWDFKQGVSPDAHTLSEAVTSIDWRAVQVFCQENQWFVQLNNPQAALDLGGIAKGWIADELGKHLAKRGFSNYLLNLGGNIVVQGKNAQGKPWSIGIKNLFSTTEEEVIIRSTRASIVTSGTYQRCFTKEGLLLHHILNPKTGFPVTSDAVSATIVCEKSLDAEGFSTSALSLGVQEGLAFCTEQPEIIAAFFIDSSGTVFSTSLPPDFELPQHPAFSAAKQPARPSATAS